MRCHTTAGPRDVLHHEDRGTVVRGLRPRESWPLLAVHAGLSPTSRRLRYSTPTPRLTAQMVRVLTDLRPGHHEAYAAWRHGRPIAIVRWIRIGEAPYAAELALEVVDAEQGRGVGRALVAHAAVEARREGVRTLMVSVDPDNDPVHAWLSALGARAVTEDADRFALPVEALIPDPSSLRADSSLRHPPLVRG